MKQKKSEIIAGEGYLSMVERCKEVGWIDLLSLRPCYRCDDVYQKQNMTYIKDKHGYLCKICVSDITIENIKH